MSIIKTYNKKISLTNLDLMKHRLTQSTKKVISCTSLVQPTFMKLMPQVDSQSASRKIAPIYGEKHWLGQNETFE